MSAEPTDEADDLRSLLATLDPKARDTFRRVLIRDQADRDTIASQLMRHRVRRGDDWADIIDILTMHPDARRRVVRLLAVIAGHGASRNRAWPATPRGLAGILRRLGPALREAGIVVDFGREGHEHRRVLRVHVVDTMAGLARVLPLDTGRQTV